MKNKYYIIFLILFIILTLDVKANDGAYLGSGNQLIPIEDSDISVKKEILSITRNAADSSLVDVSVYYEFYNPGKAKILMMGFEAFSPSGDVDASPKKGEHPYITNFSINVNNQKLPYEVAIVKDSVYYKNGVFNALTNKQIDNELNECEECADFFYVYHFDATFNHGLNIVKHTYTYQLSSSVNQIYAFNYVLSAAMRWANKQIDDFTLNIDMGNDQYLYIPNTFFDNISQWQLEGVGKSSAINDDASYNTPTSAFYIKQGKLVFKAKNFKPKGELSFYFPRSFLSDLESFNFLNQKQLPYNAYLGINIEYIHPTDGISLKILRNLPFAYKGYVFSTPEIQKYYKSQIWYYPNPLYKAEIDSLSDEDKEWVSYWTNYK